MQIGMKVVASALVGALMVMPAKADPDEAKKLLELSASAVENLQSLSADIEVGATGGFANFLASAKGKLLIARMPQDDTQAAATRNPFEFRLTGKGRISSQQPEGEFDAIYRDRRYEWMADDEKQQRIRFERIAGRDREVRLAKEFLLDDIFAREPHAASIRAEGLEMAESKTVGGILCDAVRIPVGTGGRYTILYIPRTDFIPRRIEQSTDAESPISGTMFKELKNVKVNGVLDENAFNMPIPTGYSPDPNPARIRAPIPNGQPGTPITSPTPRRPLASPFELSDPSGQMVALNDQRGKMVVLDFWGTWLPASARQGMGVMQALSEKFADQPVSFYGLNFRERDSDKALSFFNDGGFTYNVLLNAEEVQRRYGVRQFPTMYIIGFDGEVVEVVNGYKPETTLNAMIEIIEKYLADKAEGGEDADGSAGGSVTGTSAAGG